jgi:hypothetical protein
MFIPDSASILPGYNTPGFRSLDEAQRNPGKARNAAMALYFLSRRVAKIIKYLVARMKRSAIRGFVAGMQARSLDEAQRTKSSGTILNSGGICDAGP